MIPKFRAWHKKEKRMYEVITVAYDFRGTGELAEVDCLNPLGFEHDALEFRANEIELIEWTGLRDKEGTEIYEGDIVKDNADDGENILLIKWFEKLAMFLPIPIHILKHYPQMDNIENWEVWLGDLFFSNEIPDRYLTVIGNRFENPELLEGE